MLDSKENIFITILFLLIGFFIIVTFTFNNRLIFLENTILKQNKILDEFITNIRDNLDENTKDVISNSLSGPISKDATELAKISAENYLNENTNKINVSDNSDSDNSDSDSVDDSSDESDYDSDNYSEEDKNIDLNIENVNIENSVNNIKKIEIEEIFNTDNENSKNEIKSETNNEVDNLLVQEETNNEVDNLLVQEETNNEVDNLLVQEETNDSKNNIENQNNIIVIKQEEENENVNKKNLLKIQGSIKKKKLAELKNLALTNELGNKNNIDNMKKDELISLIEKNLNR